MFGLSLTWYCCDLQYKDKDTFGCIPAVLWQLNKDIYKLDLMLHPDDNCQFGRVLFLTALTLH